MDTWCGSCVIESDNCYKYAVRNHVFFTVVPNVWGIVAFAPCSRCVGMCLSPDSIVDSASFGSDINDLW